jgi:hypothetical protein
MAMPGSMHSQKLSPLALAIVLPKTIRSKTKANILGLVKPIVDKYGLGFVVFRKALDIHGCRGQSKPSIFVHTRQRVPLRWWPSRLGTRVSVHSIDERLDMSLYINRYRLYLAWIHSSALRPGLLATDIHRSYQAFRYRHSTGNDTPAMVSAISSRCRARPGHFFVMPHI